MANLTDTLRLLEEIAHEHGYVIVGHETHDQWQLEINDMDDGFLYFKGELGDEMDERNQITRAAADAVLKGE